MISEERFNKLYEMVSEIHAAMRAKQAAQNARLSDSIVAAPDSVLDNQRGDPKIRKSPTKWEGRDLAGLHYSDLEVKELEAVVDFLKWKLDNPRKDDDPKYVEWNKLDCARALGWIRRKKAGWKKPDPVGGFGDSDGELNI